MKELVYISGKAWANVDNNEMSYLFLVRRFLTLLRIALFTIACAVF